MIFFFFPERGAFLPVGLLLPVHAAIFSISQEEAALPVTELASSLVSSSCKNRLSGFFQLLLSRICRWHVNLAIEEIPSGCTVGQDVHCGSSRRRQE